MTKNSRDMPIWIAFPLSVVVWPIFAILTIFWAMSGVLLVMPFTLLFDWKRRNWMHFISVLWAKSIILLNPLWKIEVEGANHIEKGKRYLIISNHQSILDIIVVLSALPVPFKFLSKKEVYSIPFIGWHMFFAGYIGLDRSSRQSGREALHRSEDWLRRQVSVIYFPEGTRTTDGHIKDFKMGAFKVARQGHADILPVVLDGTGDAIPKNSRLLKRAATFKVSIGKPVALHQSEKELAHEKDLIREEMVHRLEEMRK